MPIIRTLLLFYIIAATVTATVAIAEPNDISSLLMRSTFRLQDEKTFGTVFIMGEPLQGQPGKGSYVLITAAHVLENIKGDNATLFLRKRIKTGYVKLPTLIKVRQNGKPLWVRHPQADVAAMRIALPQEADLQVFSTDLLATDAMLEQIEVHPGDELLVLGFPYGAESNEAGFPILRSGRIAGFPLLPTSETRTFLLDFPVFNGNSGGPVFMHSDNRVYGGSTHYGTISLILGVVSEEEVIEERLHDVLVKTNKLGLAVVVHARFVKELLGMLPPLR